MRILNLLSGLWSVAACAERLVGLQHRLQRHDGHRTDERPRVDRQRLRGDRRVHGVLRGAL